MNYSGKFEPGTSDSFPGAGFNIDAPARQGGGDSVTIPDAHLLFSGDYSRSGADLIVSDQLHRVVVPGYFHGDKRPTLLSPDGAPLPPDVIEALTGHVQYAQAAGTAAATAAKVVGHVVKMTGSASVVRNGVTIALNNGDNVLQNDVVQTGSGSSLGLVMIDGTTFNLSAGARLMLNDLTYDANSTSNASLFTLVQGAASFVAGQVAKTGDMKVGTPVATMGIRGTAVILDISAVDGKVSISVIDQRDGQVHTVQVYNTRGILIGTVTSNGAGLTLTPVANFEVIAQESNKTVDQVAAEFNAFQILLQTYDAGKVLFPDLPQHTDANPNPNTTTRFAGSPTPDSPSTVYHSPTVGPAGGLPSIGTGTPVVIVSNSPGATPTGAPVFGADPIFVTVVIPPTPLPFVVNPTTVPQISSGPGDHFGPAMSASGDVVYDPDGIIYFYDRETGTTIRVTPAGDGFSYGGQTISSDGRYIAYQGTNGTDTFVYIYGTDPSDAAHYHQQVQLVAGGSPAISGDGSTILVEHGGSIGIYNLQGDLQGTITAAAAGTSGTVWRPAISADGHVVAFWSSDGAAAGGSGHLFAYDLSTGTVTRIADTATGAGTSAASFSADGRYVVYQSDTAGGHSEIYLYDLSIGQVIFHTANAAGASYNPVLSPDGHFIVFASDAHLVPGDGNAFADTYTVDVTDPLHPVYRLVSVRPDGTPGDADSNRGAAISAGGKFVAFATDASNFSNDPDGGDGDIFMSDPSSGRSAIIYQTAASPPVLHAGGVIALTGLSSDRSGITLSVRDAFGNPTSLFTAAFNAGGDIVWNFNVARADAPIASLQYGQDFSQSFSVVLIADGGTITTPVTITVHNGIQPTFTVVDAAPGAAPVTLAQGTEDTFYTITAATLLAGAGDIDTPLSSLSITDVSIRSGGGSLHDNEDGTWTYTPAANFNGAVVFDYTVSDGNRTASSTASLTIAGVNDVATITGTRTGSVVEDSSTTAGGSLTVHDVDGGEAKFREPSAETLTGAYGDFTFDVNTGTWTYALVHGRADGLTGGQVEHDTLTVTSLDGTASRVICVTVTGSNDAPEFTGHGQVEYAAGGAPMIIASEVFAGDVDSDNYDGGSFTATVMASSQGDTLSIVDDDFISVVPVASGHVVMFDADGDGDTSNAVAIGDLANNYGNADSVTVDLNGNATDAAVAALAQAIGFENGKSGAAPGPRTVTFTLQDGGAESSSFEATVDVTAVNAAPVAASETLGGDLAGFTYNAANGHWYAINDHAVSWTQARAEALDVGGYLVTITSWEENDFVANLLSSYVIDHDLENAYAYVGGSDAGAEGVWLWTDGPEANQQFWQGGTDGFAPDGSYSNWQLDNHEDQVEPNGGPGENYMYIRGTGEWTDYPGHAAPDLLSVIELSFVEDNVTIIPAGFLLANDTDVDSATLSINGFGSGETIAPSLHAGMVELLSNGSIRYTPAANYSGPDSFTYAVRDSAGAVSNLATASFNVAPVNDAPQFAAQVHAANYAPGGNAVAIVSGVGASDIDSADYAGGSLTATVTGNAQVGDMLSIFSEFITVSGSTVSYDADGYAGYGSIVQIGTLSSSGTSLTVTLNADADNAAVEALTEAIHFSSLDPTEQDRTVHITLNDGDGTANGGRDFTRIEATVHVAAEVPPTQNNSFDVGVSDGFAGSSSALPGTQDAGVPGATVTEVSSDGLNFTAVNAELAPTVHGTYFDFQVFYTGSDSLIVANEVYSDSAALIAAIEANEGQSSPLSDTFYYTVEDQFGNNVAYSVTYTLSDLTFDGTGPMSLRASHEVPLSLAALNVHDAGAAAGLGESQISVTVTVSFGSLVLGPEAGGATVTFDFSDQHALTIQGTATEVNEALDALSFLADGPGQADLMISGIDGPSHTATYLVGSILVDDVAPTVAGDMSVVAVTGGHEVMVTVADLNATDPDTDAASLVFRIDHLNHGRLVFGQNRLQLDEGDTFTLADVQAELVYYQSVGTYVGQDHIALSLFDSVGVPPVSVILSATIVDAQFTVLTTGGYDFNQDNPVSAIGSSTILPGYSATTFTLVNVAANREFIFSGTGFDYTGLFSGVFPTTGTITSIQELTHDTHTPLVSFGVHVDANDWIQATQAAAAGDQSLIEALTSQWTFNFIGNVGADGFAAGDVNDIFTGRAGNDTLEGEFGYDRVNYGGNAGPIGVLLADGEVHEFSSGADPAIVSMDTLRSIEMVTGSNYDDVYSAIGFGTSGPNVGSNVDRFFNEFEGRGGDDLIFGNGQTRVSYYHATSGVTVTFTPDSWTSTSSGGSGMQTGDASVGNDQFSGVNQVRGSFFNDTFTGSTNPFGSSENFEGLGGADVIDGGGGFDRAVYFREEAGLVFNMAAGTVLLASDNSNTGDTLRSIEAIWGTDFGDTYDANNFSPLSTNAGSAQFSASNSAATSFNEFEGGGGNDTVIGNGNTRVAFHHATAGVVVKLGADGSGVADGDASVGHDTFTGGVSRVRGSEFNDIITGNGVNNTLEGRGGNDVLDGQGGNDALTGGAGADIFVYDGAGDDWISDFSRADGDRIDLRAFSPIHSINDLNVATGMVNGVANSTIITFGATTLGLQGYDSVAHPLQASDFIFTDQVAVTVQTADGYDFGTLYDDLANSSFIGIPGGVYAIDAAKGISFELIGTGIAIDAETHEWTAGAITEINILDTINPTDPAQRTQGHVLANTNGWNIDASALYDAIQSYASGDPAGLAALNGIFNAASYSVVGGGDGISRTTTNVLFGGDHADAFRGASASFGSSTVDYSHATSGVSVNLMTGVTSGTAAAGDTFVLIDSLRGSDFNDSLTGDAGWNRLEGGLGDDTLDGGGGINVLSYEHATPGADNLGVTVDLSHVGPQDTIRAGVDTLSNFQIVIGSAGNDTLIGDGTNNLLLGGAGADVLRGGIGIDGVDYENAPTGVTVSLADSGLNTGEAEGDTFDSIENLSGSQFNDVLAGNGGNNEFWGFGGNDTFVFNVTEGIGDDTVNDFRPGQDRIQLDYFAFDPGVAGSFDAWLSTHAATAFGNSVLIDFDLDGQNTLMLQGVSRASLHMNDFILHPGGGGNVA